MKIELDAGDKIKIPIGCKATIKDNLIIIEYKQEGFKDGDILLSKKTNTVLIFSNYRKDSEDLFDSYFNNANNLNHSWISAKFRHATEEEKQVFFDELKAKGLKWNAETKIMEEIR